MFGFQLQRHPGRDVDIPDWYTPDETRLGQFLAHKSGDYMPLIQHGSALHDEL